MNLYKNGNYTVMIMNDGTKVRYTKEDSFIPSFAENCDVKITDMCSQGCPFCYEGCTKFGAHANLFKYPFLLNSLHPYTEMALNGNDLDHPQLEDFLISLKRKKVFANITVNQNQFMTNFDKLKELQDNGLVYGIGVSLISGEINDDVIHHMRLLKNIVLHAIVGILTEKDISKLKNKGIKILLLGYKNLKRGVSYMESNSHHVMNNMSYLYEHVYEMTDWFDVVSFDNLAIDQLDVKRIVPEDKWDEFYMGDDGHYTFYIDMVKGEFAKNSLSQERYPIGDMTIDDMFKFILEKNQD